MSRTEQLRDFIQTQMDSGNTDRLAIIAAIPDDIRALYDTPTGLTGAVNAVHGNMLKKVRAAQPAETAANAPYIAEDVSPQTPQERAPNTEKVLDDMVDHVRGLRTSVHALDKTSISGQEDEAFSPVNDGPSQDAANFAALLERIERIERRLDALEDKPTANPWRQGFDDAKRFADSLHAKVRSKMFPGSVSGRGRIE